MKINEDQIVKRFLILGVVLAAVVPRMPHDTKWSIGGEMSHNFRKLLLVIVGINIVRLFLSGDENYSHAAGVFADSLGVIEVTGLAFISLLTPYLMQKGLAGFINVRPGKNLIVPLYSVAILSFLGVVLSRTVHPNYWALKKLAMAVTGPSVISTLQTYNSFTTIGGGRNHGRGFVISQILMTIEYWHIVIQLCCAAGYAFNREDKGTGWDTILQAARNAAFTADWTRVLVHGIFLNLMDEQYHGGSFTPPIEHDEPCDTLGPPVRRSIL